MGKWGYSEPSLWWAALHWNVVHDSTAFSFSVAALHIPCKVLAYFLTLSSWKFIVSLSPRIYRPPLVALLIPVWCKEGAKFHFPLQSLVNPVPFIESALLTEPCCLPSLLSVRCPLLDSLVSCIGRLSVVTPGGRCLHHCSSVIPVLVSGTGSPSILFFKIVLSALGPLHFQMYLSTSLSILENKTSAAIFISLHCICKSICRELTSLLEKEMATHSSVLAWRIPGTGEPGGLPSMGLHRVRHDWSNLTAAAATSLPYLVFYSFHFLRFSSISLCVYTCIYTYVQHIHINNYETITPSFLS